MTDSSDNPFRDLAGRLALRNKKSGRDTTSGRDTAEKGGPARAGQATPGKGPSAFSAASAAPAMGDASYNALGDAPGNAPGDAQDAALFLNAVSRIKPLPRKQDKRQPPAGQSLADRMRANAQEKRGPLAASPDKARQEHAALSGMAPAARPAAHALAADHQGAFPPSRHGFYAPQPPAPADPWEQTPADPEEKALFAKAMQGALPLNGKGRALAPGAEKKTAAPAVDPARALREILEGRVEFALHHTDEYLEGFVVGVDPLVLARLRGGRYSPEKHIDLHGMNARQAFEALTHFIKDAYQRNMRCVVVVTGRGRNSPDGMGVLRPLLQNWLTREPFKRVVLAFCTAKACDGGPGAVYVLLRKYKKSRGKIIWERTPSDDDFPDA